MPQIRAAHLDDVAALLELYQHLSPGDARPELADAKARFAQLLSYPGSGIFVYELNEALVASCVLIVVPNLTRGGMAYGLIENVVTHSAHRNQGFGKSILDFATNAAWSAGCYKVMLMTGSKKPETLHFYSSAGFEQTKTAFGKRRISRREDD